MNTRILLLIAIIFGLFIFMGATCSPISPPAFTPSKSLKIKKEGSISTDIIGGAAGQVFDLGGYGAGVSSEYRVKDDIGVGINLFGARGEDDLENNHSLFQGGIGITRYLLRVDDKSYIFALEPRMDFTSITNGSFSIIPNFVLHSSYRISIVEPRLTLRTGASLLASRGDEVNIEKPIDSSSGYQKAFLKDIVYLGGDLGILFHIGRFYIGPSTGIMFTKTFEECSDCSDGWFYYMLNLGADF